MPVKKYTQNGIFSVMVLLIVLAICIVMFFVAGIDEPITAVIFSFIVLTLIICLLVFYKLTIVVDDTHLSFIMGIGLVRKTFPLSDISCCKAVINSPLHGVGIHITSSGWLYNVSGKYAIELSFKSSRKKIRIGTDKPDEVALIVSNRINGSMAGSYYDKGGNSGIYLILAMVAATCILPVILLLVGSRDTEVNFSDSGMNLSGVYGLNVLYSDIQSSDTMQSLPALKSRTNGYAAGRILKGHFKLQDQSKVLLFIKKGVPPYIRIKTSEVTLYLNFDSPLVTRDVYTKISNRIGLVKKGI
jgi:hypothetical protein